VFGSKHYSRTIAKANAVSRTLQVGKKGDKVIPSSNRTRWNIMDIGVLQTGAQTVPIIQLSLNKTTVYILNHSEALLFCF
jgi:long-chain acyl-CoA synthetase